MVQIVTRNHRLPKHRHIADSNARFIDTPNQNEGAHVVFQQFSVILKCDRKLNIITFKTLLASFKLQHSYFNGSAFLVVAFAGNAHLFRSPTLRNTLKNIHQKTSKTFQAHKRRARCRRVNSMATKQNAIHYRRWRFHFCSTTPPFSQYFEMRKAI